MSKQQTERKAPVLRQPLTFYDLVDWAYSVVRDVQDGSKEYHENEKVLAETIIRLDEVRAHDGSLESTDIRILSVSGVH